MDLIGILIRLLLALFYGFFLGQETSVTTPLASDANNFRSYTLIESVDVVVMESFPMQINLVVTGTQPDGCQLPVIVTQAREGNTVTVEIYRDMPMDMICTAVLVPYEDTIRLDGGFESGSYTFHINDVVIERDL